VVEGKHLSEGGHAVTEISEPPKCVGFVQQGSNVAEVAGWEMDVTPSERVYGTITLRLGETLPTGRSVFAALRMPGAGRWLLCRCDVSGISPDLRAARVLGDLIRMIDA